MSIVFTFIFLVLIAIYMTVRKKRYPLDAANMTIFLFAVIYILIPEVLPLSYVCKPFCNGVPWLVRFVAFIGLGSFILGLYLSNLYPVFKVRKSINISEKFQYKFSLFIIIISFSFLYVYAQSFGGFLNAFSYGSIARFTGKEIINVSSSAIAVYFTTIIYIVFAIIQYKLHIGRSYKKGYIILMLVSIGIVLSHSIISGSRGSIFQLFLLSLFFYLNLSGMKINLKKIIIVLTIGIVGLFFVTHGKTAIASISKSFQGQSISESISNTESKSVEYIYGRLILEFSHSIKSLGIVIYSDIEFNSMRHFLYGPLDLVPTKLLGINYEEPIRIHEINSKLVVGDAHHGIPPGIIASFWYGGGVFSVFFGLLLSGVFIGWIQKQSYEIINKYPSFTPVMLYMFFKLAWFINNGDLSVFLKNQIHIILFFILFLIFIFLKSIYKIFFKKYIYKKRYWNKHYAN